MCKDIRSKEIIKSQEGQYDKVILFYAGAKAALIYLMTDVNATEVDLFPASDSISVSQIQTRIQKL